MATVADTFVEAAGTPALTAHTPTGTDAGTSWVEDEKTGVRILTVASATDRVVADGNEEDDRQFCSIRPSPTVADYEGSITLTTVNGTDTAPFALYARWADTSNYYTGGAYRAAAAADSKIFKKVAGTVTELASGDTAWANGAIMSFSVSGTTLDLQENGTSVISVTDSALSAAGSTGIAIGNFWVSTDNISTGWVVDDYSYVETGSTIKPGEAALTVALTLGADAAAIRVAQAALSLSLTLGAEAAAIRAAEVALTAALTLGVDGAVIRAAEAALTAAIVLAAEGAAVAGNIKLGEVSLLASLTLGAEAAAIRAAQVALDAAIVLGAEGAGIRAAQSALAIAVTLAAEGRNIVQAGEVALSAVISLAAEGRNSTTPIWAALANVTGSWTSQATAAGSWASLATVTGSWTPQATATVA